MTDMYAREISLHNMETWRILAAHTATAHACATLRISTPEIRWYVKVVHYFTGDRPMSCDSWGFFNSLLNDIWLRASLSRCELTETVLHEAFHSYQYRIGAPYNEIDAERFARREARKGFRYAA